MTVRPLVPRLRTLGACALLMAPALGAQADMPVRCTENHVEFLVGGQGAGPARTCSGSGRDARTHAGQSIIIVGGRPAAGTATAAAAAASPVPQTRPAPTVIAKVDDEGRRQILQHELDTLVRRRDAALGKERQLAGATPEQREEKAALAAELRRHEADIVAIQREIGRIKP